MRWTRHWRWGSRRALFKVWVWASPCSSSLAPMDWLSGELGCVWGGGKEGMRVWGSSVCVCVCVYMCVCV